MVVRLAGCNTGLGLWLAVAPFLFDGPTVVLYDTITVGILVTIAAGYNAHVASRGLNPSVGGSTAIALLGLYAACIAVLTGGPPWLLWNSVVGVTIAVFAGTNAYATVFGAIPRSGESSDESVDGQTQRL